MRFPLEVFDAVRAAFPPERPVSVRVSGTDWADGGWDVEQTIAFAQALEARGLRRRPRVERRADAGAEDPGRAGLPGAARAGGEGRDRAADHRGRAHHRLRPGGDDRRRPATRTSSRSPAPILYDPRWPWHAAAHLGASVKAPKQYLRSQPPPLPEPVRGVNCQGERSTGGDAGPIEPPRTGGRARSTSSPVDHLLRRLGVPLPLHADLRRGVLDLAEVVRGQFDGGRPDVLLQAVPLRRPRDGHDPRLLGEQPRERDLGGRRLLPRGDRRRAARPAPGSPSGSRPRSGARCCGSRRRRTSWSRRSSRSGSPCPAG